MTGPILSAPCHRHVQYTDGVVAAPLQGSLTRGTRMDCDDHDNHAGGIIGVSSEHSSWTELYQVIETI